MSTVIKDRGVSNLCFRRGAAVLCLLGAGALAGTVRTQTIQLRTGWNSVYLEVSPTTSLPADVFGGSPVDVVAAYLPSTTTLQFLSDPGEQPWRKDGWGVWYAPERPEATFSNLEAIVGNRPYLVHATQDVVLSVTGSVKFSHVLWKPNSLNYVGFCLEAQAPPTFSEFFAGSAAHSRFYRLVGDKWQKVTSPATTLMKAGEAYWVYCTGRSAFQGPVAVSIAGISAVSLSDAADTASISLLNAGTDPRTVTVAAAPVDGLPLAWVELDREQLRTVYRPFQSPTELPELDPQTTALYRIHLRSEQMTETEGSLLLRLSTDNGQVIWIPVAAKKSQ